MNKKRKLFSSLLIVPLFTVMSFIVVCLCHNGTKVSFLKYTVVHVTSNDTIKNLDNQSLIVVKNVAPNNLKSGDIIAFFEKNNGGNKVIKIGQVKKQVDAHLFEVKKLDNSNYELVEQNLIIGRHHKKDNFITGFIKFLISKKGVFFVIIVPFILIGYFESRALYFLIMEYRKEIKNRKKLLTKEIQILLLKYCHQALHENNDFRKL